jgi:hypothetical protein
MSQPNPGARARREPVARAKTGRTRTRSSRRPIADAARWPRAAGGPSPRSLAAPPIGRRTLLDTEGGPDDDGADGELRLAATASEPGGRAVEDEPSGDQAQQQSGRGRPLGAAGSLRLGGGDH